MKSIADERGSIAAPQVLVTARWALLAALALLTAVQALFPMLLGPQLGGPYSTLLLVVAGGAVNAYASRNKQSWSAPKAGAHLLLDVVGLTCFLSSANTSNKCSWTWAATYPKPRDASACTAEHCSENSIRNRFQNNVENN